MSLEEKIQHFIQELETDGYFVMKSPLLDWSSTHKDFEDFVRIQFQKTTGSRKRDINGGYLDINQEDRVRFDVFKGSSRYGTHFKSNPKDHEMYGTSDPDLMGILNFLEVV